MSVGDISQHERLVYWVIRRRFAWAIRCHDDMQEWLYEGLYHLLERQSEYKPGRKKWSAWATLLLTRHFINRTKSADFKKRQREAEYKAANDRRTYSEPSPDIQAADKELIELMHREIERLPTRTRDVMAGLAAGEERSAIAARLGLSKSAVQRSWVTGLRMLRLRLIPLRDVDPEEYNRLRAAMNYHATRAA